MIKYRSKKIQILQEEKSHNQIEAEKPGGVIEALAYLELRRRKLKLNSASIENNKKLTDINVQINQLKKSGQILYNSTSQLENAIKTLANNLENELKPSEIERKLAKIKQEISDRHDWGASREIHDINRQYQVRNGCEPETLKSIAAKTAADMPDLNYDDVLRSIEQECQKNLEVPAAPAKQRTGLGGVLDRFKDSFRKSLKENIKVMVKEEIYYMRRNR
jgi:hypothetical protein